MQAREIFKAVPKGNYVFIKGNKADANAVFLKGGQDEIIKAAVDSGDIKNVGETFTDSWKPELAQTEMEQFLTANSNKVDAVVASNDGTAGGAISALPPQLVGKILVTGQDAALDSTADHRGPQRHVEELRKEGDDLNPEQRSRSLPRHQTSSDS